jgi:hypothetical protein
LFGVLRTVVVVYDGGDDKDWDGDDKYGDDEKEGE